MNKHPKSNMSGMIKDYQKMYDAIKNWDESPLDNDSQDCYLYGMGWAIDDMAYHGWTGEPANNEKYHYKKVCECHKALKVALEDALGINKEKENEK